MGGAGLEKVPAAGMILIEITQGDITLQQTDAIVNAANTTLLGGGGVDGAIHRAAGPELLVECRALGGCSTGEARITKGYRLAARYVIHTVGPVWNGGSRGEDRLLQSCYENSLGLAVSQAIRTVAFPSISTGAYRFPVLRAARIAVSSVRDYLKRAPAIEKVVFVCFSKNDYDIYHEVLKVTESF